MSVPSIFAHPTIEAQCELLLNNGIAMDNTQPEHKTTSSASQQRFPASMQQESLYFVELLHPKGPEYLVQFAAEIKGELNKQFLEQSFAEVIRRHGQSLGSYFTMENDTLTACVSKAPFSIIYHDWTAASDVSNKIKV